MWGCHAITYPVNNSSGRISYGSHSRSGISYGCHILSRRIGYGCHNLSPSAITYPPGLAGRIGYGCHNSSPRIGYGCPNLSARIGYGCHNSSRGRVRLCQLLMKDSNPSQCNCRRFLQKHQLNCSPSSFFGWSSSFMKKYIIASQLQECY